MTYVYQAAPSLPPGAHALLPPTRRPSPASPRGTDRHRGLREIRSNLNFINLYKNFCKQLRMIMHRHPAPVPCPHPGQTAVRQGRHGKAPLSPIPIPETALGSGSKNTNTSMHSRRSNRVGTLSAHCLGAPMHGGPRDRKPCTVSAAQCSPEMADALSAWSRVPGQQLGPESHPRALPSHRPQLFPQLGMPPPPAKPPLPSPEHNPSVPRRKGSLTHPRAPRPTGARGKEPNHGRFTGGNPELPRPSSQGAGEHSR